MSSSKAGHDCDPLLCYFHYMTTGLQLVNGLQCVFDVLDARTGELLRPDLTFKSPTFTSTNDDPQPFVWTINDSSHYPLRSLKGHSFDRITSIVVKHGALIDSISIETLHGKRFRAGGSGGGSSTKVKLRTYMIPVDETSSFTSSSINIILLMLMLTLMMLLYSWKCRTIAVSVDSSEVRRNLHQAIACSCSYLTTLSLCVIFGWMD